MLKSVHLKERCEHIPPYPNAMMKGKDYDGERYHRVHGINCSTLDRGRRYSWSSSGLSHNNPILFRIRTPSSSRALIPPMSTLQQPLLLAPLHSHVRSVQMTTYCAVSPTRFTYSYYANTFEIVQLSIRS